MNLLQAGGHTQVPDLTDRLDISRRTLFRDIKLLQQAGVPCYHEPSRGYRLKRGYYLPPTSLTIQETLGLLLLGKHATARKSQPFLGPALSAISKLITQVPEEVRAACADLTDRVTINPGPLEADDQEQSHYTTLQRCIDEGRTCDIVYRAPMEEKTLRCRLNPYALHFAQRSWYVMGWTDHHKEVRVLKLTRFEDIQPTDDLFNIPKCFTPASKIGKAWMLIPGGKVHDIELEFTAKVAMNVTEVRWHASQNVETLPDGRCRVRFEVDGLNEIAWWVCGYADQVRVVKPVELRKMVKAMHERAAKMQK